MKFSHEGLTVKQWHRITPPELPFAKGEGHALWLALSLIIVFVPVSFAAETPDYKDPVTGMEFVFVKGGCFQMGDVFGDGEEDERPLHEVCVNDFYMGKYEVTQGQWKKIMDDNPSDFKERDDYPVESVSWEDARKFIMKLNSKGGLETRPYRLPTEAEWEYAARSGGKKRKFSGVSDAGELHRYANFCDKNCTHNWNTEGQDDGYMNTSPAGTYKPNGLGLYDMTGNLWEWTADWYGEKYYSEGPKDNPKGPVGGFEKVIRGGSWGSEPATGLRVSIRGGNIPAVRTFNFIGFRLVYMPAGDSRIELHDEAYWNKLVPMVRVKGGCYQMGCGSWTSDCYDDEQPVHEVCVDDYYIGKYEVTQGLWRTIMGNNPAFFKECGDDCPIEQVSWNDAQKFIKKLNRKGGFETRPYRLPTEAEWEYAARSGGKREKYSGGNDVDSVAWYASNSGGRTHSVGTKGPNGLGTYDMSGNVWEWVQDWYDKDYYSGSQRNNPTGPSSGEPRVLRGGSWTDGARDSRSTNRSDSNIGTGSYGRFGFRLARTE